MTLDADELVVGANGRVWVGPTEANGGTMPSDSDTGLGDPWRDMGYLTADGATFTDSREVFAKMGWQSFYALRRIVTSRDASIAFSITQWNAGTVAFALGGAAVTAAGGGEYVISPPDPADLDERALVLEWQDGTKDYRLVFPKGLVTNNMETNIVRTDTADLPIVFSATPATGDDPYTLYTNDASMADLGTGS